jgi:alpha-L-fucosidase 2
MKGAATFCLDMLVKDKEGCLVTSPSTSPEHKYRTPDGYTGATLYGSTADLAIIRECFRQTIAAARILGTDADFQVKLEKTLARLHPYRVGRAGSLQEWYHDWEDFDPQHRHQSHLIGLYPGEHLHPETTPELAKACAHTLEVRGENSTGWSKGWRAALWARLRDGERAYRNYRQLLTYIDPGINPENLDVANGTYPNLLNGPPYQIDGNLSGTAALAEMLLQSDDNGIRLLPAAPSAWSSGSVRGLRARGNFTVDFAWKEGKVTDYRITSEKPRKIKIHLNGEEKEIISEMEKRIKTSPLAGQAR